MLAPIQIAAFYSLGVVFYFRFGFHQNPENRRCRKTTADVDVDVDVALVDIVVVVGDVVVVDVLRLATPKKRFVLQTKVFFRHDNFQ